MENKNFSQHSRNNKGRNGNRVHSNNNNSFENGDVEDSPISTLSSTPHQLSVLTSEEKLRMASDIESRLLEESKVNGQQLRVELCNYLTDIILSDSILALRRDCLGRLWRNCFYGRITELRNLIHAESKKSNKDERARLMYKDSLRILLKEAIVLYEYLVENLEKIIVNGSVKEKEGESAVACTYRLLIHLGDLHRYATNSSKAETSYLRASRLAPGRGNPYNQLAVVAQQDVSGHPRTCLALYWYARSLLANIEPFETSRANLTRLFYFNRSWLKSNPLPENNLTNVSNKKQIALVKSQSLRRFMAEFVDLNSHFLMKENQVTPLSRAEIEEKASLLFSKFKSLLSEQCFGDGLLVKMVVILIFSVVTNDGDSKYAELPLACTMRFGDCIIQSLCTQLQSSLNLRGLSPLLVLCLWVQYVKTNELSRVELPSIIIADDFWTHLTHAANQLHSQFSIKKIFADSNEDLIQIENDLLGFLPLHPQKLPKAENISPLDGYLPLEQSVLLLKNQKSQRYSQGTENEALAKVSRFLYILRFKVLKAHEETLTYDDNDCKFCYQRTDNLPESRSGIDLSISKALPGSSCLPSNNVEDDDDDDEIVYTGIDAKLQSMPKAQDLSRSLPNLAVPESKASVKENTISPVSMEINPAIENNVVNSTTLKPPPGFSHIPARSDTQPILNLNNSFVSAFGAHQVHNGLDTYSTLPVENLTTSLMRAPPPGFEKQTFMKDGATNNVSIHNQHLTNQNNVLPSAGWKPGMNYSLSTPTYEAAQPMFGHPSWPVTANPFVSQSYFHAAHSSPWILNNNPTATYMDQDPKNELQFLGSLLIDSSSPKKDSMDTTSFWKSDGSDPRNQKLPASTPNTSNPFIL